MNRSKIVVSLLIILTAGTILSACKKSNSSASTGVSATINSAHFQSGFFDAVYYANISQFSINAYSSTTLDSVLAVSFSPPVQLNVPISSDSTQAIQYIKGSLNYQGSSPYGPGHVVVTVTAYDTSRKIIAGTFSGFLINTSTPNDTLSVANGKFNVTYRSVN